MILQRSNPLLRQTSKLVTEFGTESLKSLVDQLFDTMRKNNGAGLAAVQIGVLEQVLVYGFKSNPRYPDAPPVPETCMINPKILWFSEKHVDIEEGCLSIPDKRALVSRPEEIKVQYKNIMGETKLFHAKGFESRVIQHETDHLNGILFIDRLSEQSKFKLRLI